MDSAARSAAAGVPTEHLPRVRGRQVEASGGTSGSIPPGRWEPLGGDAWAAVGVAGDVDPHTRGRIGNVGALRTAQGWVLIDSGVSARHAQDLVAQLAIDAGAASSAIDSIILTHARQEFIFGASTLQESRHARVMMHAVAARLMAARCANCLRTLRRELGEDEMRGTQVPVPQTLFGQVPQVVPVGAAPPPGQTSPPLSALESDVTTIGVAGRRLRLITWGTSSGPGDTAVLDLDSRVLFAGGLVDVGWIPDVQDGDIPTWISALQAIAQLAPQVLVPGHGPIVRGAASIAAALQAQQDYLQALQAGAAKAVDAGRTLAEAPDAVELPRFAAWTQYESTHRRNVSIVYLRREREQLYRMAPASGAR